MSTMAALQVVQYSDFNDCVFDLPTLSSYVCQTVLVCTSECMVVRVCVLFIKLYSNYCLMSPLCHHCFQTSSPCLTYHQPPKDWILLFVIAAMVAVDLVFFVIVTAVDSPRFYATEQRTTVGHEAQSLLQCVHSSLTECKPKLYIVIDLLQTMCCIFDFCVQESGEEVANIHICITYCILSRQIIHP